MLNLRLLIKTFVGQVQNLWDDFCDFVSQRSTHPRNADSQLAGLRYKKLGWGDGRWTIATDNLDESSIVYSVGVGHDISFDLALIRHFKCTVHAFDPTLLSKQWLDKQHLPENFCFHELGLANYSGSAEFRLPKGHSVSFSMASNVEGNHTHSAEVRTIEGLMTEFGHENISVLKIDIEGAEFDLIDDLARSSHLIDQLLIEFHDRLVSPDQQRQSLASIEALEQAGFRLFYVSRRGLEYSFLGPNFFNIQRK